MGIPKPCFIVNKNKENSNSSLDVAGDQPESDLTNTKKSVRSHNYTTAAHFIHASTLENRQLREE